MNHKIYWMPVVAALLLAPPALTQDNMDILKTDWIEQTKGYQDEALGAEVRKIEEDDTEGNRSITVAIPRSAIEHPGVIEEVVVVGKKPREPEPLLNARFEWLDDYDKDNYGLIIHLGKESTWPIRLYMSAEHGYLHLDSNRLME